MALGTLVAPGKLPPTCKEESCDNDTECDADEGKAAEVGSPAGRWQEVALHWFLLCYVPLLSACTALVSCVTLPGDTTRRLFIDANQTCGALRTQAPAALGLAVLVVLPLCTPQLLRHLRSSCWRSGVCWLSWPPHCPNPHACACW